MMKPIREMTKGEVVAEEVGIIQDLVSLDPYRDIECVQQGFKQLSGRRDALRRRYLEISGARRPR